MVTLGATSRNPALAASCRAAWNVEPDALSVAESVAVVDRQTGDVVIRLVVVPVDVRDRVLRAASGREHCARDDERAEAHHLTCLHGVHAKDAKRTLTHVQVNGR